MEEDEKTDKPEQSFYQIKVRGHLDDGWAEWFGNLVISHDREGNTKLTGPIVDQAALHGLLLKIWKLKLTLVAVNQIEKQPQDKVWVDGE